MKTASSEQRPLHLSGLNGLRAMAAIAVVVSHTRLAMPQFGLARQTGSQMAAYGVTIFFALSGFLITYLLLLERDQSGVQIRKFYLRRILRIWPLYYLYLGAAILVAAVWQSSPPTAATGFYVFLSANIPLVLNSTLPFLGHYWSLGVEEQFYLFWPWIIRSFKSPLAFMVVLAVLQILARAGARVLLGSGNFAFTFLMITRFDCMAIGAIGAILLQRNKSWFRQLATHIGTQILCWFVFALLMLNQFTVPLISHTIVAMVTVFVIIAQVTGRNRIINLEHPLSDFLGKISYGTYVVHPLVIFFYANALRGVSLSAPGKAVLAYAGVFGITIVLAGFSYRFYEKPFLRLKDRYSIIRTRMSATGRMDS